MNMTVGDVLKAKGEFFIDRPTKLDVKSALMLIVDNREAKALNYCVNYAKYGIELVDNDFPIDELKTQLLYVLNNMTHWRGDTAKAVRVTLKKFAGVK